MIEMFIFLLSENVLLFPNALNLIISVILNVLNAVYLIVSVDFILVEFNLIFLLLFNIIVPFEGACVI